jgi:hypothetical protein
VDAVLDDVEFLDDSIAYLQAAPAAREKQDLSDAGGGRATGARRLMGPARAPQVALDLIEGAATWSLDEGIARRGRDRRAASRTAGAELDLRVQPRRAPQKKGVGVPDAKPRRVEKVGIVGAGLMATQLATLFLKRLEVPLVIRDLSQEIVDRSLAEIRGEVEQRKPFLATIVSGTTGWDGFEGCDLVLEAVVEEMSVKQEVFATLRELAPNAILASNTSSLSLAEMGADVGLHFFNPVAVLPLVEIVRTTTPRTRRSRPRGTCARSSASAASSCRTRPASSSTAS